VWGDHLLPRLTCKDAARLGRTCKALRVVVREHFHGKLGKVKFTRLQAALTTFPRAREVTLEGHRKEWGRGEEEALMQWLRDGGSGRHLQRVWSEGKAASCFIHKGLREGAPPSLRGVDAHLQNAAARASLTRGRLGGMHELRLSLECSHELEPQMAALGLVRQLPALATLEVTVRNRDPDGLEWPPFIPPSLKALHIGRMYFDDPVGRSLGRALPDMLGASGAALERLEINVPPL
jgi:hypothetical protein